MSDNSDKMYEVGYGKPPKTTRFKKGKSGNPSGRPKKPARPFDPGLILEAIENEEMVVLENGKRKPMKKVEIQFRLHFTKAINGDLKSARRLVSMSEEYFTADASTYWDNEFIGVEEAERRFGRNWSKKIQELNALVRGAQ
jgi:hypothetical protein